MTVLTRRAPSAVLHRLSKRASARKDDALFRGHRRRLFAKGTTRPRAPFVRVIVAISFTLAETSFLNAVAHSDARARASSSVRNCDYLLARARTRQNTNIINSLNCDTLRGSSAAVCLLKCISSSPLY